MLYEIKQENKICYLLGDYNINLFDMEKHIPTSEFIESLFSYEFIPFINKQVTSQNVDKPKRRQPKRRQTETSTNRIVNKPKRRQTETSTNRNVDNPKRRQTKTSTDQNVDTPKRRQTKTSTL